MEKKLIVRFSTILQRYTDIYEDGTYRCDHWPNDDYSEWKIDNNAFFYRHRLAHNFVQESEQAEYFHKIMDALFEQQVLEQHEEEK